MEKVYIYCLKDTEENIRYIGKTTNIKRRLYSHIAEATRSKTNRYVHNWIKSLLKNKQKPIIEIIEICNESNWIEKEQYWIKYYRNIISNLCNSCDGGTGGMTRDNLSKEQLLKKKKIMSNTFSKFTNKDKEIIWNMIQDNKTQLEIMEKYPEYTRHIDFGVRNGRQWKTITNLDYINKNLKRKGYTCRNGLYMIRRKINEKYSVVFSSRSEKEIITWLEDEQHIGNGRLNM